MMMTFSQRHPELVWSNSKAGEEVYLRAALLKPRYHTILDACVGLAWSACALSGLRSPLRTPWKPAAPRPP